MPITMSAAKRMRSSAKSRTANRVMRNRIKTARTAVDAAGGAGDAAKFDELFRKYCSVMDKAAKAGVVGTNYVARNKSRAAARRPKAA